MNYNDKLKLAKEALDSGSYDKETIEYIFPELKESEDEKIKEELKAHIGLLCDGLFPQKKDWLAWIEKQGKQKPAFEMKTPEESLGIDSDTYNKIVDECIYGEHKPEWTPMDEQRVENLLAIVEGHGYPGEVAWLNSLKDRVQPKQNEQKPVWSEEDEEELKIALDTLEKAGQHSSATWLKNVCLVPQSTWKPSDEQMLAINTAINVLGKGTLNGKQLIELQEQLKKLREK